MRSVATAMLWMILVAYGFAQTHTTVRHRREAIEEQPAEIAQAEEAIQKSDFASAQSLLKKALDKDPKSYLAWFDLGFVENKLGHTDESVHAYRQSVAAKPEVFESNLNLGLMLARSNNPEAERFLRAATQLKPADHVEQGQSRAWLSLGHMLENHKPEEALQAYEKAAALTPKDPEPHISAGLLCERLKDFPKAEAEYKQVLTLDPQSNEAVMGLVNLYMKSGRLAEAEPLLRQLAVQRPDDAGLHLQLGRVLAAKGDKDGAATEIQTALRASPGDTEAQRDLADLLVQSGKFDDAAKIYHDLSAQQPNDPELHHSLGEMLLKQKRFPEAQEEFLTAVKLKPDFGPAWGSLAVAANENQNYQLAIKAADMRAQFMAETPVSYFLRATAYDHLRDFQQASKYYHLFLESAKGQYPDQEWQARHRLIAIEPKKR
jgi:tetratricopeptide (TPR) repeat protein